MVPYYSKAYMMTKITTDNRVDIVISLYERAMSCLTQAMEAVEESDGPKRTEMVHQVAKILAALSESLDYSESQEIATDLFGIYCFQMRSLLQANRENDLEGFQVVKSMLAILLDGWRKAADSAEAAAIREKDIERLETHPCPTIAPPNRASLSIGA